MNTQNRNAALVSWIRAEIKKQGPQSFAWFMQQVLYHPEHGYYSSGRCRIGREGDYYTSVSVGPLYGQLLAWQFFEIWARLGKIADFYIVEQGAHDGQFAQDVLGYLQSGLPEFFDALRYRILEPFPVLEQQQRQRLKMFDGKVEWRQSPEPFTGVHFSNELLDAMPVRLISEGIEQLVSLEGDEFVFVERPVEETIFNQAALNSVDQMAANLERGYILAIDYGVEGERFDRSIQVRAAHRQLGSPFRQIGNADITMRVHWKSIVERAQANGLRVVGFTDQHHFLTGIISQRGMGKGTQPSAADSRKTGRQLQTLLHPEMLGRAFQVLALVKNVEPQINPLAGFKFVAQRRPAFTPADSAR